MAATTKKDQTAADKRRKEAEAKAAELAKEIENGDETPAAPRVRVPFAEPAFKDEKGAVVVFDRGEDLGSNWTLLSIEEGTSHAEVAKAVAAEKNIPIGRLAVMNKRFVSTIVDPSAEAADETTE